MTVLRSASSLLLRAAGPSDVPLLARWLNDPRVLEFYDGRDNPSSEGAVRTRYFEPRVDLATGLPYDFEPCIAELGRRPIGFVQCYRLPRREAELFEASHDRRVYGLDLFVGEPSLWGTGIGTRLIGLTRDYLRESRGATRIVADPHIDNPRSVRAFEKAGFRKIRLLPRRELHEGTLRDCWWMEYP